VPFAIYDGANNAQQSINIVITNPGSKVRVPLNIEAPKFAEELERPLSIEASNVT
jgi:hypothetical protein